MRRTETSLHPYMYLFFRTTVGEQISTKREELDRGWFSEKSCPRKRSGAPPSDRAGRGTVTHAWESSGNTLHGNVEAEEKRKSNVILSFGPLKTSSPVPFNFDEQTNDESYDKSIRRKYGKHKLPSVPLKLFFKSKEGAVRLGIRRWLDKRQNYLNG